MLNEDETKARLTAPLLHECGWSEEYIRHAPGEGPGVLADKTNTWLTPETVEVT